MDVSKQRVKGKDLQKRGVAHANGDKRSAAWVINIRKRLEGCVAAHMSHAALDQAQTAGAPGPVGPPAGAFSPWGVLREGPEPVPDP